MTHELDGSRVVRPGSCKPVTGERIITCVRVIEEQQSLGRMPGDEASCNSISSMRDGECVSASVRAAACGGSPLVLAAFIAPAIS